MLTVYLHSSGTTLNTEVANFTERLVYSIDLLDSISQTRCCGSVKIQMGKRNVAGRQPECSFTVSTWLHANVEPGHRHCANHAIW